MQVEVVNVSHRSGTKEGKAWSLSTVHVRTPLGDLVEVKFWKHVDVKVGDVRNIVFEGRYSYKTKSIFGVAVDLKA